MKSWIDRTLLPLSRFLDSIGMTANLVTAAGVLVTVMVPVELLKEHSVSAGFWLLGASFFDLLDGSMARNLRVKGHFGAFWDSTLDRVSEAIVFGGVLLYYYQHQNSRDLLLSFIVCILSLLVPYVRARAEGLGVECEVGILPRPGRVILLALGLFAGQLTAALTLIGGLSLVTVIQRIHWVWMRTK